MYRTTVRLVREPALPPFGEQVHGPSDAARIARELLGDEAVEVALVMFFDRRHRLRGWHEVGRGGIASAALEPREVYQVALLANAAAVMVAHNHPSGDPTPSADDVAITRRIREAGRLLGVEFLDHIIVAGAEWCSLQERGFAGS